MCLDIRLLEEVRREIGSLVVQDAARLTARRGPAPGPTEPLSMPAPEVRRPARTVDRRRRGGQTPAGGSPARGPPERHLGVGLLRALTTTPRFAIRALWAHAGSEGRRPEGFSDCRRIPPWSGRNRTDLEAVPPEYRSFRWGRQSPSGSSSGRASGVLIAVSDASASVHRPSR